MFVFYPCQIDSYQLITFPIVFWLQIYKQTSIAASIVQHSESVQQINTD